jgi:hypothetical protein
LSPRASEVIINDAIKKADAIPPDNRICQFEDIMAHNLDKKESLFDTDDELEELILSTLYPWNPFLFHLFLLEEGINVEDRFSFSV